MELQKALRSSITSRPAGWCEMIARFKPVSASNYGFENGGFYFCYTGGKMLRQFAVKEEQTIENQKLKTIETEVLSLVPGCAVASDQFCRMMDLAIDFVRMSLVYRRIKLKNSGCL